MFTSKGLIISFHCKTKAMLLSERKIKTLLKIKHKSLNRVVEMHYCT